MKPKDDEFDEIDGILIEPPTDRGRLLYQIEQMIKLKGFNKEYMWKRYADRSGDKHGTDIKELRKLWCSMKWRYLSGDKVRNDMMAFWKKKGIL